MRVAINAIGECHIPHRKIVKACLKVLKAEGARKDAVVSLSFVDEAVMEDMNRRYLSRGEPTDVLAFAMQEECGDGYLLGDVVICPRYILRNSHEYGVKEGKELEFVTAHGVLHLLGYGDDDAEGASEMERRQREILGLAEKGRI